MSMWYRFNPNPVGNRVEDCVQRAISAALDVPWEDASDIIHEAAKAMGQPEQPEEPTYSFSAGPPEPVAPLVDYSSDTAFSKAIEGRKAADIWPIMDELMTALQVMLPRLYDSVIRKLNE